MKQELYEQLVELANQDNPSVKGYIIKTLKDKLYRPQTNKGNNDNNKENLSKIKSPES